MNEEEKDKLFEKINPSNRSDINLNGYNLSSNLSLGDEWVIDRLMADFILLEFIDTTKNGTVMEDGLYKSVKETSLWRKAVVRAISPWSASTYDLKYGDYVILPDTMGLSIGSTQYVDPEGNVKKMRQGVCVNGMKIFGTLKKIPKK